jgi:hypothetical protein
MAKLLLINLATYRPGVNNIGDVVGIFKDGHAFSPAEIAGFDIGDMPALTETEIHDELIKITPSQNTAYRLPEAKKWVFDRPEEKRVWQDQNGVWNELATTPKYPYCLPLKATEIDSAKTADKATAITLLQGKLELNIPKFSENLLAIDDLNSKVEISG